MAAAIEMIGRRFGRLVVTAAGEPAKSGKRRWICACDCGAVATVHGSDLRSGHTGSCGCFHMEKLADDARTHGMTGTPAHNSWSNIKDRCRNPNNHKYADYGGRGIDICDEWFNDFTAFLADVGPSPGRGYSVDRIDNEKGYEPGNCRWATKKQQARNTRRNRYVMVDGVVGLLPEMAERLGLKPNTLKRRAIRGTYGVSYADQPERLQRKHG